MSRRVQSNELPAALAGEFKRIAGYVGEIQLSVGVLANSTEPYPNGKTVAWIAAVNTYGYQDGDFVIPPRPFLKPAIREVDAKITRRIVKGIGRKEAPEAIVESVGNLAVNSVVKYIDALKIPKNAPYTIARKGADNPLVDTGQLKNSITWRWDNE